MMQKKDIYNIKLNIKIKLIALILSIFFISTSGCGKKADPIRPNAENSTNE